MVDQGVSVTPRYKAVGVVSSGTANGDPACAVMGQYGIYSSVAGGRDWIDRVLTGLETPTDAGALLIPSVALLMAVFFIALL